MKTTLPRPLPGAMPRVDVNGDDVLVRRGKPTENRYVGRNNYGCLWWMQLMGEPTLHPSADTQRFAESFNTDAKNIYPTDMEPVVT